MILNIKRGMLTALQTQLLPDHEFQKRFAKKRSSTILTQDEQDEQQQQPQESEHHFYSASERSVSGLCEVDLAMKVHEPSNEVHINKRSDVNKCAYRPTKVK